MPFLLFVLVYWNLRMLHGQRQDLLRKVGHIESYGLDAFVKIKENPKDFMLYDVVLKNLKTIGL